MNGSRPVAPELSRDDVRAELQRIHAKEHRTLATALYGRWQPDEVEVAVRGTPVRFRVVPARCEIELREALDAHGDEALALLVDYTHVPPLDVRGRLADGQVRFVDRFERLARFFGALAVSPQLAASPLARVLREQGRAYPPIAGTVVDLATAWRAWLSVETGLPREGALAPDMVVAFCAGDAGGPRFAAAHPADLRDALVAWIEEQAGRFARRAWEAWEAGDGVRVAALAVLFEAAHEQIAADPYLQGRLVASLGEDVREAALLRAWGELAGPVLVREPALQAGVLAAAERLAAELGLTDAVAGSRRLGSAFGRAAERLARELDLALARPAAHTLRPALEAFAALAAHRLADDSSQQGIVQRARMAVRLIGWLGERPAAGTTADVPVAAMLDLARRYARDGGFVDLARQRARGETQSPLGAAIGRVLVAADAARDEDDRSFAAGLRPWLEAGRTAGEVLPIERVLDVVVARFLGEDATRKALVLLLDGMAWANAVELLLDLEAHHRWAPLRWPFAGKPVIAGLPTTTDVSRSAFFAGRLPRPGEHVLSSKDPDRLAEHTALRKLLVDEVPRLLLQDRVQGAGGAASAEAVALVESPARLVAVVVNAIDQQLAAGPQVAVRWERDTVLPLPGLLDAAERAGRAVLMVADHGHVPGTRLAYLGGGGGPARWRALGPDDVPHAEEVVFPAGVAWAPRGKERVACLMVETASYGSGQRSGEHGGASLAEVVAPAVLIGPESLATRAAAEGREDAHLELSPVTRPAWWDPSVAAVEASARVPVARPPVAKRPTQPDLFAPPSAPVVGRAAAAVSRVRVLVGDAKVFSGLKGERRKQLEDTLRWAEVLEEHEGRMPADVFAQRTGMPPWRVGGAVAVMGEFLNLDGYAVIRHDAGGKQVVLDLRCLEQVFGA